MNTIYITYRDLSEKDLSESNVKNGFEIMSTPPRKTMIIKEQIVPGLHGFPDLHITHIKNRSNAGNEMVVICYTNKALSEVDRKRIGAEAILFAKQGGRI